MTNGSSPPIVFRDRRFLPRAGVPIALLIIAAACLAQSQGGALCLGVCEESFDSSIRDELEIASLILASVGALWLAVATGRPRTAVAIGVLTSIIFAASLADASGASTGALVVLFLSAPIAAMTLVEGMKSRIIAAGLTALGLAFVVIGGVFAAVTLAIILFFILLYLGYLADILE